MRFLRVLSLLLLTACTGNAAPASVESNYKIVYGLTLSVSGIDPHINQNAELGIVLRQVYDTLVYRHPETREFVPGLAASWIISDDGLTYTFKLRENVTFHDGTLFNADAVAANLERIMNPETASQRARLLLGPLTAYQVVDNQTINLILSEPYSPLLDGLSQVYTAIASPKALKDFSLLRYQYHQVGTGPFKFVEYVPEDRIVIQRNPDYTWGPDFYMPLADNAIQEVEFRFFRDAATRTAALESGDADVMGELLPLDARELANNPAFVVVPVAIPGQPLQFYMNTKQSPTDNLAVRQALIYATNRNAIVDAVYQSFSPIAWGPLAAITPFYNPGVVDVYAYNIEQAQTLLTGAGYRDSNNDGILDLNGDPLEVTVIQPAWGLVPEVTQFLQDQWRTVGIRAVIQPVPGFTSLIEEVEKGDYNFVSFDAFGLDPVLLNARFLSTGSVNWVGFGSPELDTLLLEASRQSDSETRRVAYGQAQAIIMQQALTLPIRDYVNLNAHTARLKGLIFDPYGWFPLLYNTTIEPE